MLMPSIFVFLYVQILKRKKDALSSLRRLIHRHLSIFGLCIYKFGIYVYMDLGLMLIGFVNAFNIEYICTYIYGARVKEDSYTFYSICKKCVALCRLHLPILGKKRYTRWGEKYPS